MSRIILIHHSGLVGGAGVSFINIVKTITPYNEVIIYVPSDPLDIYQMLNEIKGEYQFTLRTYGQRIGGFTYYSGGDSLFSIRLYYRGILALKQVAYWNREIRSINPDIVVVNSKILSWMSQLKEIKKRKSVCFVRETMQGTRKSLANRLITAWLDDFSKVIFLSEYDKRKESLNNAETYVIHNYIDTTQFNASITKNEARKKLGISQSSLLTLYVGGVSAMKGFDLAVQAVLSIDDDVELIVAGNDFEDAAKSRDINAKEYAKTWKKKMKEIDKRNRIHMVGRQTNISLYYAACDVLLFPMRSPHQSRPVFEAGYFSKPVIISDFDNVSEFVQNSYNGFRVIPNSADAIAEKIKVLLADSQMCKTMGQNNKHNTDQLHNKEKNCGLIRDVLEG